MKQESLAKHALLVFAAAALLYLVAFYGIQYFRTRHGAWQVTFQSDAAAQPALVVSQPQLGISGVRFVFPDQHLDKSNFTATLLFDQPLTNVPFGRVIYLDTTFLPGSVVFGLFGHEIQLLPRVLIVDRREVAWSQAKMFVMPGEAGGISERVEK